MMPSKVSFASSTAYHSRILILRTLTISSPRRKAPHRIPCITSATITRWNYCISSKRWRRRWEKPPEEFSPAHTCDVPATFADVTTLLRDVGFTPSTPLEDGIQRFIAWYMRYYAKCHSFTDAGE